ncbi:hypothetical protein ACFPKZ_06535 [Streptosporangium amethystogenes subsp. fukuiense]|uniref:hypothetical protein n=1 Tax=Streptosporangium amethystogenes TaxID=2002 RepID=UPI0036212F92
MVAEQILPARHLEKDIHKRLFGPNGSRLPIVMDGGTGQPGANTRDHAVPLPGRHDPHPLDERLMNNPRQELCRAR